MDDSDNAAASGLTEPKPADNEARPEPATVAPPASDTSERRESTGDVDVTAEIIRLHTEGMGKKRIARALSGATSKMVHAVLAAHALEPAAPAAPCRPSPRLAQHHPRRWSWRRQEEEGRDRVGEQSLRQPRLPESRCHATVPGVQSGGVLQPAVPEGPLGNRRAQEVLSCPRRITPAGTWPPGDRFGCGSCL